ncbi:glycosyltransferase involved in cell wall biosynthesis [Halomonas fontilapidosi]|uniref:Glycosyltransferase involved in cell wall biosynthesis n=1 Tax=Halomonas fontilapidosi TaxID=616675 RepID=A0A7W5DMJ0_9GAMM|nr:glycosyltransferase [Halomonas fontilapidosi]MBB3185654.1 glycosyltransferase involved in cell wall biosynthesis [Halomonas fontilapidosi]
MKKIANIVLNDFTNDSRVLKISKSLAKFGYDPTVVAMHNSELSESEAIQGINTERIRLITRPWPKLKPIQFLKYIEFLLRSTWRFRNADIVHCNDLNALPVGLLIKLFGRGRKVVYDCHEYETEVVGLKGIEKKGKKWLERKLIPYADAVVAVSDSIANEYSRLYDITKPYIVLNCPAYHEQPKRNLFREYLGIRSDQTIFLYQGGLSQGRGIELLLEAFSDLELDKNVLVCMGYGPLEGLIREYASHCNTVFFHPAVSSDVLLSYTSSADYGILFYEDTCLNHRYCSPNKIFEYLMAGLPVLTSNLFEMKRMVEAEDVGVVADVNTIEGFKRAIASSLGKSYSVTLNNIITKRKIYCWEEQEKVLKEIYDAL